MTLVGYERGSNWTGALICGALVAQLIRVQFHGGSDTVDLFMFTPATFGGAALDTSRFIATVVFEIPDVLGKAGGAALLFAPGTGFEFQVQEVQLDS